MATSCCNTSLCKNTGRAREQSPGQLSWQGRLRVHQHTGLLCQEPAENKLPDDFSLSSRQFATKTSKQCHHAVTEVPCIGLECDANPSQVKTADHTTKSTVSVWKAGRSVFSRCIKQVYILQRTRKEHSFCLQMIICSIKKKSNPQKVLQIQFTVLHA